MLLDGATIAMVYSQGEKQLLDKLRTATSNALQVLLSSLKATTRATVLTHLAKLRVDVVEILEDKLAFLDHAPLAAVGAFYSVYDDDIQAAKGWLRLCIDEYDRATANGKEKLLHRISPRLFRKNGMVRNDIDLFLAADQPLWKYSRLFVALMEYALLPIVERRIEAVHAEVQRVGRAAFGAGLPCVCAAIRCARNLDLLAKSSAFKQLACDEWRSRTLLEKVLHLRYSRAELKTKTFREKLDMMYQTGAAQEFDPCPLARANMELFKIATSDTRVCLPKIPEQPWNCNLYLKSVMERGAFIGMPADLFHMCELRGDALPAFPAQFKPAETAIVTARDASPAVRFNAEASRLFQVVREFPGNRVSLQCHHVADDRRWHMVVHPWSTLDTGYGNPNKILADIAYNEMGLCTLDVRPLVLHIARTLSETVRFRVKASTTTPACRPLDRALPSHSSPLPIADEATHTGVDVIVPVQRRMGLASLEEQEHVLKVLSSTNAYTTTGITVPLSGDAMDDVNDMTITALAERGAVRVTRDADGVALALVPSAIDWKLVHGLHEPVPLALCRTSREDLRKTKLELLIHLETEGWRGGAGALEPFVAGGELIYVRSFSKPAAYFACLCSSTEVLAKNVPRILHTKTALYYRCLLQLDMEALADMLPALEDKSEEEYKRALKNAGVQDVIIDPKPIEDNPLRELFPIDGPMIVPLALPLEPTNLWTRAIASAPGFLNIKVYFDHGTSGGKNQKGYAVCNHCGVCQWKVCAGTKERYCAGMLAWQASCADSGGERSTHRGWLPSEASFQKALDDLTLDDF